MKDLLSIIVPIYRVERYLEKCIESIRSQTYKNIEIILVDDGSDDGCPQICDYYAGIDSRVKVIHQENSGIDIARKSGLKLAKGKYIGYVDSDDWIEPLMYEKLIEYAKLYKVDVVESGVIDTWGEAEKKRTPYIPSGCYKGQNFIEKVEPKLLYAGVFFQHGIEPYIWSKLFLKEKIEKYQLLPGLLNKVQNDTMVSLPCIAETKSIYITHECYYHYRVRVNSAKRKIGKDSVIDFIQYYPEIFKRFKGTLICSKNDKQLQYFFMYWLIIKAPYVFDNLESEMFLTPFGEIEKKKKVVLYGAGAAGIILENYIRNVKGSNLICWADKNFCDLHDKLNVCKPEDIVRKKFDYIIISILREEAVKSAKKELVSLGVPEEKILWIEAKYINNPELLLKKAQFQGKYIFENYF